MNKLLLGAAILLTGCTAQTPTEQVVLDMGDLEDYMYFMEDRDEEIREPVPFKAEPLFVSAIGKVQAQPDIAVITARISATDKNESKATEEMGGIINAVQASLSGLEIETGFTAIVSNREFDQACLNENNFAWQRHTQITQDYYFNRNLDQRGDTKTKRRPAKERVPQQVCMAQEIEVATNMVIRVQPPEAAGDVLRALSDAGAENARLYGYDFTDYDALYQDAAAKAVTLAREKAETVARIAGGELGEIESFSVSKPERTGRFGPQPNVIRPANRYQGQDGSVIDRHLEVDGSGWQTPRKRRPAPAPFIGGGMSGEEDVIVVTASRIQSPMATPEPISVADFEETQTVTQEAATYVTSTGQEVRQSGNNTNALSISLLSGPQTISVAARLGYSYSTPLDGKIIVDPDLEN
ncbi:SIMPL domain-containing protein [Litorimonas sp. WD9-15]|uniref:SIMPL domain-containing protein n=1 Tax=Litorimonas sp. WD9-15 TaxID=3418716 RepID=UPI003D084490